MSQKKAEPKLSIKTEDLENEVWRPEILIGETYEKFKSVINIGSTEDHNNGIEYSEIPIIKNEIVDDVFDNSNEDLNYNTERDPLANESDLLYLRSENQNLVCMNLNKSQIDTKPIKRRIWLTLEKKLEIIKNYENGSRIAKIARERGMNESSVRTIVRKKEQIKEQGTVEQKCLCTIFSVWSKTTLITGGVGGTGVDPSSCKTSSFFLGPWLLVYQFIKISN